MANIDFNGMTVNERLGNAGLFVQWDEAVAAKNREKLIELLTIVQVQNPERTVDKLLSNLIFYGYKADGTR